MIVEKIVIIEETVIVDPEQLPGHDRDRRGRGDQEENHPLLLRSTLLADSKPHRAHHLKHRWELHRYHLAFWSDPLPLISGINKGAIPSPL